jgi:hypothetical protein
MRQRGNASILVRCTSFALLSILVVILTRLSAQTTGVKKPAEAVLVAPDAVSSDAAAAWKAEGFTAVVLLLDERYPADAYKTAAKTISDGSFDLYYWVEVGRNPEMAREHPEWMAALGIHDDWRSQFPDFPKLDQGHVVKAWPWVPISYADAFAAHVARIKSLLERVPPGYRGILLNDLQGGPSACGCGNLQCRWAIDYGVPSTAKKLPGNDAAVQIVVAVKNLAANSEVIPVWTTECAEEDMALGKLPNQKWTTGYCGNVDCFHNCFDRFAEQWSALHAKHTGPTAILSLQKEFMRDRKEYDENRDWIANMVRYLRRDKVGRVQPKSLWLVIQGFGVTPKEEKAARRSAQQTTADMVVVARTRIDQSYQPRTLKRKP